MKINIKQKRFRSIALIFCLFLSAMTAEAQTFSAGQSRTEEMPLGASPAAEIAGVALNVAAGALKNDYPSLSLTGSATLLSVIPGGAERFSFQLVLKNLKSENVQITEETLFLASQGGWSRSLDNWISNKIGSKTIAGAATHTLKYESRAEGERTASYVFTRLRVAADGKSKVFFIQIPITREGYQTPKQLPRLTIINPLFIGIQESVNPMRLSNGKQWLQVVGQIINLTGKPAKLLSWKVTSLNSGAVLSTSFGPDQFSGDKLINQFFIGKQYNFSENFSHPVRIEAELEMDGLNHFVMRDITQSVPHGIISKAFPVKGHWNWGNGVGDASFHGHYRNEDQRYAYDMGMFKSVNGQQRLSNGALTQNSNYFCWNQPIYSIDDGKVIAVIDNFPENNGNQATSGTGNNMVVVEHLGKKHSVFVHIRPNSAVVEVGQSVKAGDMLARVGNAGSSSAPHLHLAAYRIDETGHINAIPMFYRILDPAAFNMSNQLTVPKGTNGLTGYMTD
jgi:hypothetical protein